MDTLNIAKNLDLVVYTFDDKQNTFTHHDEIEGKEVSPYESSAEIIKIVRYLEDHHINFEEDMKGNIKLVA